MNWTLFFSTFVSIFLAELGDKTQLAVLSFSGTESSRWTVFFGAALALVASTALAVLVGETLSQYLSPLWLKRGAGIMFLVLGMLLVGQTIR